MSPLHGVAPCEIIYYYYKNRIHSRSIRVRSRDRIEHYAAGMLIGRYLGTWTGLFEYVRFHESTIQTVADMFLNCLFLARKSDIFSPWP